MPSLTPLYGGTMKKLQLIPFVLLLVGLTTVVFAAPPDPGKSGPQGFQKHHGFHQFGPRLNLTQEQREKMKDLRKAFWADTHDLRYDIKMKKVEVQKLFTDPKTDDATLLEKEKELNALKHQLMDKKAEMKVEWRKILNPEQIQMLDRIHRHHHGHAYHHHGHKGHHGHRGRMDKKPQSKPAA
jgi:Spy/CpxP family protein refolding chaperone